MSTTNLAQHEQYLKSLELSFKRSMDHYKEVCEYLKTAHNNIKEATSLIDQCWSNQLLSFAWLDELRSTHPDFRKVGL